MIIRFNALFEIIQGRCRIPSFQISQAQIDEGFFRIGVSEVFSNDGQLADGAAAADEFSEENATGLKPEKRAGRTPAAFGSIR